MKVSNFDVLKRMADDNLKIQICKTVVDMRYSSKNGGTQVTVGVPTEGYKQNSTELRAWLKKAQEAL